MKKLPIFLAVWSAFIFALLFCPQNSLAEEIYEPGTILLYDDFNDGNFDGWTVESGYWVIDSGKALKGIKVGTLVSAKISTGEEEWNNYQIELDIKNYWGIDEGVGFRRVDSQNYYELVLRHAIVPDFYNAPELILKKIENGVASNIAYTKSVDLVLKKNYHIKISAARENLQVWVDSNLIFDVIDTGTNIKNGSIFLSYLTGDYGMANVSFDNIKVTALSKVYYPVIFIPGIGGSELKLSEDFYWSKEDGHGGNYSHGYSGGEKVWVNEGEAAALGEDDYFDILRLRADGQTSEAPLELTGDLTPFGYSDIDSFFLDLGYTKGTNFFVFPYDWRKDIRDTESSLDSLVEEAKEKSGMPQVNIVAHSMGGLVARNYIASSEKAAKVNKLIELGVPHLGAVDGLKAVMYGSQIKKKLFGLISLGIEASETKDVLQNSTSAFQLLPSKDFFQFYNGSDDLPYPFSDERDIDSNNKKGPLNFEQIKTLLNNLSYNLTVFDLAESFHSFIGPKLNQANDVKLYNIVGSGQPTLGQIKETWWVNWPVKLVDKYEEIYINGDNTVPLYSASLKNTSLDLSAGAQIYYVEQNHSDLVTKDKPAMQTVKAILLEGDSLPVEVKEEKITLEGMQVSLDGDADIDLYDESNNHTGLESNGEIEENISNTFYSSTKTTKNIFIKKSATNVKVKVTPKSSGKINIKTRLYKEDKVSKADTYRNIQVTQTSEIKSTFNPADDTSLNLTINNQITAPASTITGSAALDQTPPKTKVEISGPKDSSGNYTSAVTITLTSEDLKSEVLQIEYSLDNGKTVQVYNGPFTISTPGTTTLQVFSIDKSGNEEAPQTFDFTILSPSPTPTPTSTANSNSSSNDSNESSKTTSGTNASQKTLSSNQISLTSAISRLPEVLGIKTKGVTEETPASTSKESPVFNYPPAAKSQSQNLWLLLIPPFILIYLPLIPILPNLLTLRFLLRKPAPQ